MTYDPSRHHRRSIRLKGYDYSQAGAYFVTICVKDRECFFGDVVNQSMILNDAGAMIEKWYFQLQSKFPDIVCDVHQVMPNHFHAIILNVGADRRVGPYTDPRVGPCGSISEPHGLISKPITDSSKEIDLSASVLLGEHIGSPLSRVLQWFKTMTTNEYIRGVKNDGWPAFNGKLSQPNYWEHIIRDEKSFQRIADYIVNNPGNWGNDQMNKNRF